MAGDLIPSVSITALLQARDAISYALKRDEAEMHTFASDGEGYTLTVRKLNRAAFNESPPYYAFEEGLR